MSICVRLNDNGFFTNFNQVVDWLAFGDACKIHVGVDWRLSEAQKGWDFSYGTPEDGNIWESFFEPLPCSTDAELVVDRMFTEVLSGFRGYAFYNRSALREGISRRLHSSFCHHVRLVVDIQTRINDFVEKHFSGRVMIGVHLRNPRGSRGIYGSIPSLISYRRRIDRVITSLESGQDWGIFAASDRHGLIEDISRHYPGRVVSQENITRAATGSGIEMHIAQTPRRALGVEVISDCWLLARCAHLVGVQSGVCTAAFFINPGLKFYNVHTPATVAAGRIEFELKKVYCGLFEPIHPQLLQARRLADNGDG